MHRKLLPCLAAIVMLTLHSCGDDDKVGNSFIYDGKESNLAQGVVYRYKTGFGFAYTNSYTIYISLVSSGFTMQDGYLTEGKGDLISFFFASSSPEVPEGVFECSVNPQSRPGLDGVAIRFNYDASLQESDAYLLDWSECTLRVKKVRDEYSIMFSGVLNGKHFKGSYFGPLELRP